MANLASDVRIAHAEYLEKNPHVETIPTDDLLSRDRKIELCEDCHTPLDVVTKHVYACSHDDVIALCKKCYVGRNEFETRKRKQNESIEKGDGKFGTWQGEGFKMPRKTRSGE